MDIKTAINTLQQYNRWRRNLEDTTMPDTVTIGIAIDVVTEYAASMQKIETEINNASIDIESCITSFNPETELPYTTTPSNKLRYHD